MADFYQGQTFGAVEQVTNTKMHNLVVNASISNIKVSELSNGFLSSLVSAQGEVPWDSVNLLTSLPSASGKVPPQNLYNVGIPATDASLVDVSAYTALKLYYSTYGSIATFINARTGQEFRLISQQASFPVILDAGNFLLSANWVPDSAGDNLSLIWDGTNFIEIGRVDT